MTQNLTVRDQLDIATYGTKSFRAKIASSAGVVEPDPVVDGHAIMAQQLNGLANLFAKTAEFVLNGYPATFALANIAGQYKVDPAFTKKSASYISDLKNLLLQSAGNGTTDQKETQKTGQADPAHSTTPSDRVASAVKRLQDLAKQ